jgi:hypothetical protein
VYGNVSISKTVSKHTGAIFTGDALAPLNNDKGVLFVEGYGAFGYGDPRYTQSGTPFATTGPAEAQGRFPQLWVTSPNYGPGLQIKTLGNTTYTSRTVIGDGVFDYNAAGGLNGVAGTGSDITQEFYVSSHNFAANAPIMSYQHKVSNSSNTTGSAPVFAITTYSNSGVYNNNTSVQKTVIQTRNSNASLILQANSTGQPDSNNVSLGARDSLELSVYAGPTGSTSYGTVTIGFLSNTYKGTTGTLNTLGTFSNIGGLPTSVDGPKIFANHALSIGGVQTIGTTDPSSAFSLGKGTSSPVGSVSMLKIHRNLGGNSVTSGTGTYITSTASANNDYPNGLEITSYRPRTFGAAKGSPNYSVALAVGAITSVAGSTGAKLLANTTGFFVSDTGENIAIGSTIDANTALNVSGAGGNSAIKAKGAVEITGNVGVTGNVDIVGNISATGDLTVTDTTTFGPGTPFTGMYTGRIRFNKTTGTVTVLLGTDKSGNPLTITNIVSTGTTMTCRVNFPTAMPSANIITVCHIDSTSSNHYPWTVICSGRAAGYIDLVCIQQNAGAWSTGTVDGSFISYCV